MQAEHFDIISATFRKKWENKWPPHVEAVYAIENSDLQQKCDNFKDTLSRKGHPHESDEYFHGTTLACDISKTKVLCKNRDCAICSISRTGMNLECMGKTNPENPRFGKGLYFAPHSSKSNDYAETSGNTSGFKALLMCDILPGKIFKVYEDSEEPINECPPGYDSVLGVLGSTTSYPELVVYNPHAVLPRYIIIYKTVENATTSIENKM